ncbi:MULTISPECIES: aldo/keto reductase [unclassified Streptomyces]|uniref:aldo/keto reductase n=1 Tax=unclassified Streptomyces TaxID=2593676 RepID=UPI0020343E1E|nr:MULTISPECIES: aldo/keto reductase [unclassified Streptomyces]MCM2418472.1 aldo/keto reductase [Streptomyces sp. RKAG293]MCM2429359.1 aldo/keto reductase [Streptomyces sp. RKAG337]
MEQRHLGRTGLRVSRLGLGTLTWGRYTGERDAADQLKTFWEAGGTLVDTADVYADGGAEYVLGRLIEDFVPRADLVIATKAGSVPDPDRRFDCSRGHLLSALDASLQRLGTDYVDLWQVHAFDPVTPLDETLQALDIAVTSGRARYVGVSNYCGWQLAKAATWQRAVPGRTPLASTQMEYSLLQRGIEREVLPAALDLGIGLLPSSPLGRGVLTGKYRSGTPVESRGGSEEMAAFVDPYLDDTARLIVDAVTTAADGLAVRPMDVALAWVRDRPGVTAPIVGARNAQQLAQALSVEALSLPGEICQALDDVSAPLHRYPDHDWSTL